MDHDNDELNPWGEELKLPMETINEIAGMLYRLADSGRCTQKSPEGVFSSSSNCLATWVSRLADRITAAQERERRAYERLHKCFWDKRTIQCIVRQMRDDADDLRHAFPNASEELDHFADSIAKSAKNCPNSSPKIGQLDAPAPDELTKDEKVSTSQEPGDGVTESLTDIVRDLRDCANRVEEDYHDEDVWDSSEAAWIYRDIADRIEKAIAYDTLRLSDGSLVVVRSAEIRTRLAQLDAEYIGYKNAVAIIAVLNKVHDYLGKLVRDNLVKDTPEASDLADDVWDAIHACPKGSATDLNNAAAMREALIQCELFLGNVSRHAHPTLNPGDKCTACVGVDELCGMVFRALAAPARNCDRFNSGDVNRDAQTAMEAMLDEGVAGIRSMAEYLLASAKEGAE